MTNRQPKGTPVGGQFAEGRKPECETDLTDPLDVAIEAASKFTGAQLAGLVRLTPEQESAANSYKVAALWASTDDDGDPLDSNYGPENISAESRAEIDHDVVEFWEAANAEGLVDGVSPEQFGYEFYMTRTGHGTGFWDRGRGAAGDRLTEMAKAYREKTPIVGDDGLIYFE